MRMLYVTALFIIPLMYLIYIKEYSYALAPLAAFILIILIEKNPKIREFVKNIF